KARRGGRHRSVYGGWPARRRRAWAVNNRPLRIVHAVAVAVAFSVSIAAQSVPEIAYDAADILKLPDNIHLGEAAGVATNSKGDIFVYTRTGAASAALGSSRTFYKYGSRLFQFDKSGKYVREIGVGVYGLNFAQ